MPERVGEGRSRHVLMTCRAAYFVICGRDLSGEKRNMRDSRERRLCQKNRQDLYRYRENPALMPKFIDAHKMNPLTEKQLKQAQNAAKDEFGVTHENIMYSETENKVYCVLDAPNKEAVEKHHRKIGIKPDYIHEVKTTK